MAISQPDGFLAAPASGQGRGVLVLHAWWGLNATFTTICRRLADANFLAFAPDLYHGEIATDILGAETLAKALNANALQAETETVQAARYLHDRIGSDGGGLSVIGFSMGASFALDLAVAVPDLIRSVVIFYGTSGGDYKASKAAYLGHFAENDPYEPRAGVDGLEAYLKEIGRPVTFYHYGGTGHWFFEPDRVDAYNPEAANLAWDRTLAFLKQPTE